MKSVLRLRATTAFLVVLLASSTAAARSRLRSEAGSGADAADAGAGGEDLKEVDVSSSATMQTDHEYQPEPATDSEDGPFISVTGTVHLPPMLGLHILGRKVAIPVGPRVGPGDVKKEGELSQEEKEERDEEYRLWYDSLPSNTVSDDPLQDHVHQISVRAVPVPLSAGHGIIDGRQKSQERKDEFQIDLPLYPSEERSTELNSSNEFYYDLIVSFSERVELRRSVKISDLVKTLKKTDAQEKGGTEVPNRVTLDLKSTVESAFYRELGQIQEFSDDLQKSVMKVMDEVSALMLTKSYGRRTLTMLVQDELQGASKSKDLGNGTARNNTDHGRDVSRSLFTPAHCWSGSGAAALPICYVAGDEVVYNLVSYNEITAGTTMGVNLFDVQFTSFLGARIGSQYAPVHFSWYYPSGPPFGLWMNEVRERVGYATLRFFRRCSVLRIEFPANGVLSFGFHLVDGPNFTFPRSSHPRRSFRVTMYDMFGTYIHQYRWYLAHAPKFYGATVGPGFSNGGIGYIEISVEEAGPMAMSDLTYSLINVATTSISGLTAAGTSVTLNGNLGWRAKGNWRKDWMPGNPSYRHPWRGDTNRVSYSGRTHWKVDYASGTVDNVLVSPAFTLTNLPVWQNKDDDYSLWNVGLSASGVGPTETSQARIPSGGLFSSGAACTCTAAMTEWCCFFQTPTSVAVSTFSESVASMHSHWSHNHFSSNADLDPGFVEKNDPGQTERWVEYSVDNGATWKNLYWWEDANHRGTPNVWHMCHMHAFADSDMSAEIYGDNHDGDPTQVLTDFDKDGANDYIPYEDWNLDGVIDTNDSREWDTEFYLSHIPLPASTADPLLCSTARTSLGGITHRFCISELEAPSIMYRYRFVGTTCPAPCISATGACNCKGWFVDDVALNNDEPNQGYYTNFDGSYDASFA